MQSIHAYIAGLLHLELEPKYIPNYIPVQIDCLNIAINLSRNMFVDI